MIDVFKLGLIEKIMNLDFNFTRNVNMNLTLLKEIDKFIIMLQGSISLNLNWINMVCPIRLKHIFTANSQNNKIIFPINRKIHIINSPIELLEEEKNGQRIIKAKNAKIKSFSINFKMTIMTYLVKYNIDNISEFIFEEI